MCGVSSPTGVERERLVDQVGPIISILPTATWVAAASPSLVELTTRRAVRPRGGPWPADGRRRLGWTGRRTSRGIVGPARRSVTDQAGRRSRSGKPRRSRSARPPDKAEVALLYQVSERSARR